MWVFGVSQAPDIYTAAIGLYSVWLVMRVGSTVLHYTSQGLRILATQISVWSVQVRMYCLDDWLSQQAVVFYGLWG